jgi:hypothetical protein
MSFLLFFVFFIFFIFYAVITYFTQGTKIEDSFAITLLVLLNVFILFTIKSIPALIFFCYKIDKIKNKFYKMSIFNNKRNFLLLKIILVIPIALMPLFYEPLKKSMISKIIKLKNIFFINSFMVSFIFPFIYVFILIYIMEKILGFYYKKKNLQKS